MIKQITNFVLNNGIKVILAKPLVELPITRGYIISRTGSFKDRLKGTAALATMTLNENPKLNVKMENIGCGISARASITTSFIAMTSLNEYKGKSFRLFVDFIRHRDFSKTINVVRDRLIGNIRMLDEQPDNIVTRHIYKTIYRKSELSNSIYGEIEDLERITTDDVQKFLDNEILLKDSVIIMVSTLAPSDIERTLNRTIGTLTTVAHENEPLPAIPSYEKSDDIRQKKSLTQRFITLFGPALNVKDRDFVPVKIADFALGEGMSSRLFTELRERLGYTYSVNSELSQGFNLRNKAYNGFYSVSIETTPKNAEPAYNKLKAIMKGFFEKGIVQHELETAQKYYHGTEKRRGETYKGILFTLVESVLHDLSPTYYIENIKRIESLTLKEVNSALKKFDIDNFSSFILKE